MKNLKDEKIEDTTVRLKQYWFGNYNDGQPSLFAFKLPFCSREPDDHINVEFDVAFDAIEGDLPFSLGLPSLIALGASINHKYMTLAISLNRRPHRLRLENHNDPCTFCSNQMRSC